MEQVGDDFDKFAIDFGKIMNHEIARNSFNIDLPFHATLKADDEIKIVVGFSKKSNPHTNVEKVEEWKRKEPVKFTLKSDDKTKINSDGKPDKIFICSSKPENWEIINFNLQKEVYQASFTGIWKAEKEVQVSQVVISFNFDFECQCNSVKVIWATKSMKHETDFRFVSGEPKKKYFTTIGFQPEGWPADKERLEYIGSTIDGYWVLKDDQYKLLVPPSRGALEIQDQSIPNPLPPQDNDDEEQAPLEVQDQANTNTLVSQDNDDEERTVLEISTQLHKQTIRGKPIIELLYHIHQQTGAPIYVVGGAIRGALTITEINDIDLAIPLSWHTLERLVVEFFDSKGSGLNSSIFESSGIRKQFGMMKINKLEGGKENDLDIGLLKCFRLNGPKDLLKPIKHLRNKKTRDTDATYNKYIYGSYIKQDAGFRDYTINAIYFDVFQMKIVDPVGGWQIFKEWNNQPKETRRLKVVAAALKAFPGDRGREELKADLGGRIRLLKILKKDNCTFDQTTLDIICDSLNNESDGFLSNISNLASNKQATEWLEKVSFQSLVV